MVGREADDREIRLGIGAEDLTAVFPLVGEADRDLVGALDDMEVGEDEAALVDDDARAQPGAPELRARAAGALGAEELVEEVLEEGVLAAARGSARPPARLGALDRAEMDDRGADLLGDTDEALLQHLGHGRSGRGLRRRGIDRPRPGKSRVGEVAAGGGDHHGDDDEDDTQDGPAHGAYTLAGRADDIDRRP